VGVIQTGCRPVRRNRGIEWTSRSSYWAGSPSKTQSRRSLSMRIRSVVANGRLSHHLRSHSLTKLQARSKLIPYKQRYTAVLKGFEGGLESWARYPCALTVERTEQADSLAPELWAGYIRVIRAYGIRLRSLLSKRYWVGPHGFSGRWTFRGDFLHMVDG